MVLQTLLFQGGHKTKPVKILADVTGVLKPVRPCERARRQLWRPANVVVRDCSIQLGATPAGVRSLMLHSFRRCSCLALHQARLSGPLMQLLTPCVDLLLQGRTTLLMGPPGAGKTVFLKMLAGRFKPSADLRMSGSVKYNGCTSDEFVVERTVGLVDQYDSALPIFPTRQLRRTRHHCSRYVCGDVGGVGFPFPDPLISVTLWTAARTMECSADPYSANR